MAALQPEAFVANERAYNAKLRAMLFDFVPFLHTFECLSRDDRRALLVAVDALLTISDALCHSLDGDATPLSNASPVCAAQCRKSCKKKKK